MELILQTAAVLSAVGVIIGALVKFISFLKKLADRINEFNETLNVLKKHSDENHMSLLRLTIMSHEMPIGERIIAGHKYLKEGGNGDVKSFLEKEFNITDTVDEAEHYKK